MKASRRFQVSQSSLRMLLRLVCPETVESPPSYRIHPCSTSSLSPRYSRVGYRWFRGRDWDIQWTRLRYGNHSRLVRYDRISTHLGGYRDHHPWVLVTQSEKGNHFSSVYGDVTRFARFWILQGWWTRDSRYTRIQRIWIDRIGWLHSYRVWCLRMRVVRYLETIHPRMNSRFDRWMSLDRGLRGGPWRTNRYPSYLVLYLRIHLLIRYVRGEALITRYSGWCTRLRSLAGMRRISGVWVERRLRFDLGMLRTRRVLRFVLSVARRLILVRIGEKRAGTWGESGYVSDWGHLLISLEMVRGGYSQWITWVPRWKSPRWAWDSRLLRRVEQMIASSLGRLWGGVEYLENGSCHT